MFSTRLVISGITEVSAHNTPIISAIWPIAFAPESTHISDIIFITVVIPSTFTTGNMNFSLSLFPKYLLIFPIISATDGNIVRHNNDITAIIKTASKSGIFSFTNPRITTETDIIIMILYIFSISESKCRSYSIKQLADFRYHYHHYRYKTCKSCHHRLIISS